MGKAIIACIALVVAGASWGASVESPALTVKPGFSRAFTRAELHPGTTVRCVYRGRVVSVQAPVPPSTGVGTGWATPAGRALFHLSVDARPGDGFVVSCRLGGVYWAHPVVK